MKILVLLLSLLASSAAAQQVSMAPFSDAVSTQFKAVGRVNKAGFKVKGNCTGTLIRPDVVLTAGHCAGKISGGSVFVAGWSRGDFVAARKVIGSDRHPVYLVTGKHDPRYDIGLLFLETPITEVPPVKMAADMDDDVGVMGYHRFIPHLLTGRLDCPVERRTEHVLWINCPVVAGNSGGPVMEPDGAGGWEITGVISSQAGLKAIATRIPQWVHDTLEERDRATDS